MQSPNIVGFADDGLACQKMQSEGLFCDAWNIDRSGKGNKTIIMMPNNTTDIGKTDDLGFDASRVVPTANENRPRNIAFNYIVRAA
ncbi:hypothetical protein VEE46_43800 (plasmid) [Escherichia coli]|nr:hypothetical protein VEE46_43800 [Escherichia coli]